MAEQVTRAITAEDQFTNALGITAKEFNVSIWGTFVATVYIQRSFDGGATWLDVAEYTTPAEDVGREPVGALYRMGVKPGGHTSGTANVRLGA